MTKQFLTAVIIVAVLGVGYWWWQSDNQTAAPSDESQEMEDASMEDAMNNGAVMEDGVMPEDSMDEASASAPLSASVAYDGSSFSPSSVTIKKGGTVTWTNTGSRDMWIASAQHPSHTVYAGTSLQEHCPDSTGVAFDQCSGGSSYSFTFDKAGTWRYHDHINASAFGSVIVVE